MYKYDILTQPCVVEVKTSISEDKSKVDRFYFLHVSQTGTYSSMETIHKLLSRALLVTPFGKVYSDDDESKTIRFEAKVYGELVEDENEFRQVIVGVGTILPDDMDEVDPEMVIPQVRPLALIINSTCLDDNYITVSVHTKFQPLLELSSENLSELYRDLVGAPAPKKTTTKVDKDAGGILTDGSDILQ